MDIKKSGFDSSFIILLLYNGSFILLLYNVALQRKLLFIFASDGVAVVVICKYELKKLLLKKEKKIPDHII